MTTAPPSLFDRTALVRNRARAQRHALFLHDLALDEAQDRLSMVNRTFTSVAVVTPFPQIWSPGFPNARIVRDDDVLDLPEGHFDFVVHAMSLHWANDPIGQLIQCRRALKDDGLFFGVMCGGQTLAEMRAVLSQAETEISGGLSPRIAPMGEIRDLGALLHRAGFALPVADSVTMTADYENMPRLMRDLRDMGEANALSGRLRTLTRRALFDRAAGLYRAHFSRPDGRIRATFELICLTGWAPAASQPKPLRPGSAQARLADALRVPETKLPD